MYTTPLSTLISSLFLDHHHLYSDDTQLFLSFNSLKFDSSISHLQDALQRISSWMTANLLTLNSSKTNLPKYTTLHLTAPTQLETLASSLTNILPSLTKLQFSPKPVTMIFVNFAVSGLTLIRQLPVLSLPLSFTPNLITVIFSTINSLCLNYTVSSTSRTLLLVLS